MRACSRSLLIALVSSGMLLLQVQPSLQAAPVPNNQTNATPFAVIVLATSAHVGKANAASGTTVYPGDTLDTEPGGQLRLTVAGGQIYLLSDTAANIMRSGSTLQAALVRGTIGFSSLNDQQFQIVTPEGIVEAADGLPAYGQVTAVAHNDIVISAYSGSVVLHRGAQTLVVQSGRSYYVELVPDSEPFPDRPRRRPCDRQDSTCHLVWRIGIGTAAVIGGYVAWREYSESPVDPD